MIITFYKGLPLAIVVDNEALASVLEDKGRPCQARMINVNLLKDAVANGQLPADVLTGLETETFLLVESQ